MVEGQEHAQGQGVDPVITAWHTMTAEIVAYYAKHLLTSRNNIV